MRGKVLRRNADHAAGGITPACAGKSFSRSPIPRKIRDHPRVCGEKTVRAVTVPTVLGSPPRVRGKDANDHFPVGTRRITPACAGKRVVEPRSAEMDEDHPRVCGEK